MKTRYIIPMLGLLATAAGAQESPTMTMEQRKDSVVQLKQNIEEREARLKEIVGDIRKLDERTEARIDRVVETLKGMQDSQDSGTRITRLKGETIAGLRKSIGAYNTERRKIIEHIRTDKTATADELGTYVDKLDERIRRRSDQIMELAASMPGKKDVEKYEDDSSYDFNGWHYETQRISEEWRQNRRQGVATEKELRDLTSALEDAIGDLERRADSIRARIKESGDGARAELAGQELERTEALLSLRKKELLELSAASTDPEGDEADKDTADHLKVRLEEARGDIASDHWTVLKKYGEAVTEREKIIRMKSNLEAREKWLSEHEGE